MRIETQSPFDDYSGYLNKHPKMGRMQICLVNKSDKKDRRTILWAKYLLGVSMGRELAAEETVDHIDNDKTNDSIDNLQILSRGDNFAKYAKETKQKSVQVCCPNCAEAFAMAEKEVRYRMKVGRTVYCSRVCSNAHKRQMMDKPLH